MAWDLSSLLKESEDSGEDIASSHCIPKFHSPYQVYQAVSHGFHDKVEYYFEILDPSSCVRHDALLDTMCFKTKNLLSYSK